MFISIGSTDTSTLISYAGNIISDFWPIILIVLGVSIGLLILRNVLHIGR